ncbi:hypothetical protein AM363_02305 (plasmid) [Citrobacter freundii]|uniref:Uncharacterized protein n=1 Tax=Citrobacter freundii TaxID=546 RepID=A0AB33H206_CITFR|nr:hypothetical protein [Citrobacter freundii]AXZ45869.1 hypothetical protein AM363_02305 [Citrobacter freundii]EKV4145567.1 hypothetical protein [Citrobacter freundii]EMD0456095.1 hypothetical protein [Citrobacter freundii]MBJ9095343.1 hypothetical protein [Citrobacter freundii]MDN4294634.1 hypothetical protein [Citrobacter freundii]
MTTHSYAFSRTERVWLLFSVTLLVSATIYGFLVARLAGGLSKSELSTFLQNIPVLLLISLSTGFMACTAGHYALRISLQKPAFRRHGHD